MNKYEFLFIYLFSPEFFRGVPANSKSKGKYRDAMEKNGGTVVNGCFHLDDYFCGWFAVEH